jgi:hypothetical protein
MSSLPEPSQHTITVHDVDGHAWEGRGGNLAAAVHDLVTRHAAARGETRWRLTPKGEAYVAQMRREQRNG